MDSRTRFRRRPSQRGCERGGFALAVALFSIVVIGALIAGVFFAATQESRVGRNTLIQQQAFAAAELGLNNATATWNRSRAAGMARGAVLDTSYAASGGTARVRVTKLNDYTFWVVSEGVAGPSPLVQARRRTGAVLRVAMPDMNFLGALTLRGRARIGGSSLIDGSDHNPDGWPCPTAGGAMPGVVVDSATSITYSGGAYDIDGDPPVSVNPAARDTNTYFNYGDTDWDELVSMANVTLPGGTTLSRVEPESLTVPTKRCDASQLANWGDVRRRATPGICEDYFPIIYAAGDLKLTGGSGQGILLVEGDIDVSGGFEFYGPVIVRGRLKTTGTGGHFNGGVMAANVELDVSTVLGNAVVNYSRCAIATALMGASTIQPIAERPWADIY